MILPHIMVGMLHGPIQSGNDAPVDYRRRSREYVEKIERQYHKVIVQSGNEREIGLEDAMCSEDALQRICDQTNYIRDCFDYAALNLEAIAVGHPFVEGNKRTAFIMAMLVLSKNDYRVPDSRKRSILSRKRP